jgi:hypothetical protein
MLMLVLNSSSQFHCELLVPSAQGLGPNQEQLPFWDADPSRLAALLVGRISRYYSVSRALPVRRSSSKTRSGLPEREL